MLIAADELFTSRGLGVTLEEVAAAAGVGVGTIYRRFADKDALIQAVFERKVDELAALLKECSQLPTAWEGLCCFLRCNLEHLAGDRGLQEFMLDVDLARIGDRTGTYQQLDPLMAEMISIAVADGALRDDFTVTDISMIVMMVTQMAHSHPTLGAKFARRYLELLLKGLAASGDPCPVPPPADENDYRSWLASVSISPSRTQHGGTH